MNLQEGIKLINLAKQSIKDFFQNKETKLSTWLKASELSHHATKEFPEKRGVFVTIKQKDGDLRGCIGFPQPTQELGKAVIKSARAAAFQDSRFESLKENELDEILIEISVLTPLELIKAKTKQELLNQVKLGKDGLSIQLENFEGLLLPQVPIEQNWTKQDFLNNLCHKAGLLPETWKQLTPKIYKFQAEIFQETTQKGIVKLK